MLYLEHEGNLSDERQGYRRFLLLEASPEGRETHGEQGHSQGWKKDYETSLTFK